MTTQNLLVELFVEELPPKALQKLGEAFGAVLFEQLKAQGLTSAASVLTAFASPRRLAAHVTTVAAQAADKAVSPNRTAPTRASRMAAASPRFRLKCLFIARPPPAEPPRPPRTSSAGRSRIPWSERCSPGTPVR